MTGVLHTARISTVAVEVNHERGENETGVFFFLFFCSRNFVFLKFVYL